MAINLITFKLDDKNLAAGESTTLTIEFDTAVIGLNSPKAFLFNGISMGDVTTTDGGKTWTAIVTASDDYNGKASIRLTANSYFSADENLEPGDSHEYEFTVDSTVPLTPSIIVESAGADNIYNLDEVGPDGTVTATIQLPTSTNQFQSTKPGDILTVNGVEYTITQEMIDNGFDVEVTPESNPTQISAFITDAAGNTGNTATETVPAADLVGPNDITTTFEIDDIAVDNIINKDESAGMIAVSGKVQGEFLTDDEVILVINGKEYKGNVDANGLFSIDVAGSDLVADSDNTIEGSVIAKDAAGNTGVISATKEYLVDISVLEPTVVITEDINNDGVVSYLENKGEIDFVVTVADDAEVGDTLTVNGQEIKINQDIINNGYHGSLMAVDGQQVEVTATVNDQAGNISKVAKDSATIDLTIPDADPIFLWHLGYNLSSTQGPTDQRGKFGGKYGTEIGYETGDLNDYIYIGYDGFNAKGNLIKSRWDGDFERDCGDGDVVWTMETYAGHDVVHIREDQNAFTVAKLGSGDDTYYVQGKLDSNLNQAKTNPEARSFIYTETGDDTVVIGGNGNGKVTGWGIDGGRIFTGSGSDNVTVYGEVDDGAVIDLGAGRTEYANRNDIDAANTIDSAGDVNNLSISHNLGNSGLYDYARVYGGAGDDNITVGTYVEGSSEIDLGEGKNTIQIGCDLTGSAKVITGIGDDALNVGGDIRYYSQVDLGDGNNDIVVKSSIKQHSKVVTGEGDDTLNVGYSITNYADVNLGNGNNTVTVADDVDLYSGLRTGSGNDNVTIGDDIENYAVVDLGHGENTVIINDSIEDHGKLITGNGSDSVKLGGSMYNRAMMDLGDDADLVTIAGKMRHHSNVHLGEGDNDISVGGMYDYAKITAGSGNDTVDLGTHFKTSTHRNHVAVEAGAGDDTVIFHGKKMHGKISAGEGDDTLVLDYTDNDCLITSCVHETNASTKNITGFEQIELKGMNVIDVRFEDLMQDTSRDGALFIKGTELSKVDLGSTNWNSDSANKAKFDDATGGTWMKASSTEVDGVTYDVYHHSFATNNSHDVYIEQGVVVI